VFRASDFRPKYVFSQPLVFVTIPKLRLRLPPVLHQFYWVAASSRLSFISDGDGFPLAKHIPAKGRQLALYGFELGLFFQINHELTRINTGFTIDY